jgi:hypothetical protein
MPKTEKIRYDKLRHLAAVGPRLFPPTRACLECVLQRNRCDIADPRPSRVLTDPCCLSTPYFVAPRSRVAMVCSFRGRGDDVARGQLIAVQTGALPRCIYDVFLYKVSVELKKHK